MKKFVLLLVVCLFGTAQFTEAQLIRSSSTIITKTKKEKKVLDPVKAGMQQEVSIEAGGFTDDLDILLGVNYMIGYRFNNTLFLGGGIGGGYNDDNGKMFAQAFADIRAYLTKTRAQPFFELAVGYISLKSEDDYYYEKYNDADKGLMIAPQFGINCRLSNRIGLNFGIGAKLLIDHKIYYPQLKIGLSF